MNLSTLSDEELLNQCKQPDNRLAFAELFCRHEPYVLRECYRYLKNREDTQDVSQEVFLRLLTRSHTYRAELPFKPWLGTIIRNRCFDHLRQDKTALHQEISIKIADTLEEEINTEEVARPTTEILQELLEKVDGQTKLILVMKYEQGWSIRAIQDALRMEENAVKQRLWRSRKKLQKLLAQYANVS